MSYRHGVYITELPTGLIPPRRVSNAIPFVIGTAPVHTLADGQIGPVEEPKLIYTYQEAVLEFGYSDDWDNWTLCEFFKAFFSLYSVAPMIVVNVFDPATHKTEVSTPESKTFDASDQITFDNAGVIPDTEDIQPDGGGTSYVKGTDYIIDYPTGVVTRIDGGGITAGATVEVTYDYANPGAVTDADIVGGVNGTTGALTGLELINEVFPRFRLVPGCIVAPGWSHVASTAIVMGAKAENINAHFKCRTIIDAPETVTKYSDVPGYKNTNGLTDERMILCWPKLKVGTDEYWLSAHVAALMAQVDADHEDIPYKSPSNERLQITGAVIAGNDVWLGPEQANYLNGQGIVTALNFIGGWKCWGNRTACYPAVTDVKDAFIPIGRMFDWIGTTLVLTAWQKVDFPITRRLVDTIVDSFNVWLNGLAAREYILGGRVEFQEVDNPVTDLMDGVVRFHVYVTPPSPAREIGFLVEYDPAYIQTLFE